MGFLTAKRPSYKGRLIPIFLIAFLTFSLLICTNLTMKLSKLFVPTLKDIPKDAGVESHALLQKGGYIRQTASGIYSFLPLGKMVLNNICNIINDEMQNSGALELLMPTLQLAELWQESGRYEDYGLEMLRITDRHGRAMLYGPTNEEQITQIFRDNVKSYKSLPLNLYQIQWKFRDEIRPRFGLLRGREFLMKDSYSFDLTQEDAESTYRRMFLCYLKIFAKLGVETVPMKADTGPIGGELSHEFIVLTNAGESKVYVDEGVAELQKSALSHTYEDNLEELFNSYANFYAVTEEKFNSEDPLYQSRKSFITETRGIEVGQLFYFGTKYSAPLAADLLRKDGTLSSVFMGSYGIGVSRLIAAIVESSNNGEGIIWPLSVAPFHVSVNVLGNSPEVLAAATKIYESLATQELQELCYLPQVKPLVKVLLADGEGNAKTKLQVAESIGSPVHVNVWPKLLSAGEVEIKNRKTSEVLIVKVQDVEHEVLKQLQILAKL